jgi:transposase InsO family protein
VKIKVNLLWQDNSGEWFRVVYVNPMTSMVYVISMTKQRFPFPLRIEELEEFLQHQAMHVRDEDHFIVNVMEESLSPSQRAKRDRAWEVLQFFFQQFEDQEFMFLVRYRQQASQLTQATFHISASTLRHYLIRYWVGGGTKNSVLPLFHRCGASGKERIATSKSRGRPRMNDSRQGVSVDEKMKKQLKTGLHRYYYNHRQNSLRTAYELTLKDFFSTLEKRPDGTTYPVLMASSQLPTYRQFVYWARKWNTLKREIITRQGMRVYQQNYRTIIGDATQDADLGSGSVFQIDSTIFDIYLVSSVNRDIIVGRPVLYVVVDAYSRMIMGINVTFESFNAYTGAMIALANAMTSKQAYGTRFEMAIADEEWPYCVPTRILADRGELVGGQIENAIQRLGITIQNSPPYRADYKGIVEQMFHQLNIKIKPFAEGIVVKGNRPRERGEIDYRLKSSMTLDEFTKIILKAVRFHNDFHVLSDYVTDELMVEESVEKIPRMLWKHGVTHKKGQLRMLPDHVIRMALYPTDQASVTAKGVSFKGLLYSSPFALKENWFQTARSEGSWRLTVSYDPRDLTHLYFQDDANQGIQTLTLLAYLTKFYQMSMEEVEAIRDFERHIESQSKEKELQEKIKLFQDISDIVTVAKTKTEAERDVTKSKSQRLAGIKENQRLEREVERQGVKMPLPTPQDHEVPERLEDIDESELTLFRQMQAQAWGETHE